MLSKPYLIGIVGILVLASALGLLYFSIDEEGLPLPVETSEPESSMAAQATKSSAQSMGIEERFGCYRGAGIGSWGAG